MRRSGSGVRGEKPPTASGAVASWACASSKRLAAVATETDPRSPGAGTMPLRSQYESWQSTRLSTSLNGSCASVRSPRQSR